ncbi:CDP-diacylglycerol--serine O-phosphatidyltransferase family protein [Clostridiales bacterium oral taxon 876 str. F0540]|nr:CDP-diacylglycerol--serine O-phosphatidyltransferase family protein [Clostridiales bacterium oral taxon 876 str. F0540]
MACERNFLLSSAFIIVSAIFDRYDGRIARFFGVENTLGKELDSLADVISFGVAPSVLTFYICNLLSYSLIGYIITILMPIAGAYRLARYNAFDFNGVFTGVPITIVGCFMALYYIIYIFANAAIMINIIVIAIIVCICSYLMISNIKLKKL